MMGNMAVTCSHILPFMNLNHGPLGLKPNFYDLDLIRYDFLRFRPTMPVGAIEWLGALRVYTDSYHL